MTNEIQVFTHELFGSVRMVEIDGKAYAVANDVAKALEYREPHKAISAHCRGGISYPVIDSLGRTQETKVILPGDLCRLIVKAADQSRNPLIAEKAQKFESWIFDDVVPAVLSTGHYETPEYKLAQETHRLVQEQGQKLLQLEQMYVKRFKPQTNPRYIYDCCWNNYKFATGDESKRGLNGALNDYFGYVPHSNNINIAVKDWVCKNLTIEEVEEFTNGIEDGLIVKSKQNHWVNLGGFGSNNIEWTRVLNEFEHRCAYCGIHEDETKLMPEHIVPQSVMSTIDPTKVDLVGNIVPACGKCNGSKGTRDMEEWYMSQPYYSPGRLRKIKEHQKKYEV
jgi:prophage antirepressor-like protein